MAGRQVVDAVETKEGEDGWVFSARGRKGGRQISLGDIVSSRLVSSHLDSP
eukprot:COSAG06_NODE_39253_length_414_cov_4.707937_1_plen_50_part_01